MRKAHCQYVVRVTKKHIEGMEEVSNIVRGIDSLFHEIGKGVMTQWLTLLLPAIEGDSF